MLFVWDAHLSSPGEESQVSGRHPAEPKARLALCHQTDVMSELPTFICFPRFIYNAEYFLRIGKQREMGGEKRAQVFLIKSLGRFRGIFHRF